MMNYGSMSRDSLSSNAVDIESDMFGIGSTNLVDGYTAPIPELKNVGSVDFSERKGVVLENTRLLKAPAPFNALINNLFTF